MVESLTEFLWKHCEYLHKDNTKEILRDAIKKHLEYKTIVWVNDEKGLASVCRFDIEEKTANILDVAVKKEYRNNNMLQVMLKTGLKFYPKVRQLKFNSMDKKREFVIPVSLILAKEK